MNDLCVTGGTVVDGAGAPPVRADVAVRDGRIVEVGTDLGPARRTLPADGLVVAPGFVDPHTHLDAQLFWDPAASPSTLHGVTTVLGGNCGFSVAPLRPESADYVRRMLSRVEGMPLESLETGVGWDWESFGEWLGRLDGRVAPNAGFAVGHSTLRHLVMGSAATGEPARPDQLEAMAALLHQALADGALGFTSSLAASHSDGDGRPVPSRHAEAAELRALAATVRDHPGTSLGLNPGPGPFPPAVLDLMADMSRLGDRPLNWNALLVYSARRDAALAELAASDHAAARGGHVVAQLVPEPRRFYLSFLSGFLLDAVPGWSATFALPLVERVRALADPERRAMLRRSIESDDVLPMLRNHVRPERMTVVQSFAPGGEGLAGRRIVDLATERGVAPFDCFVDVALADGLRAVFMPDPVGDDADSWALRQAAFLDPRTVVGAADAGAHLDVASSFSYPTSLLAGAVRQRALLTLPQAVRLLTDVPARLFGLRERGRIRPGYWADLAVFDPARVGPCPEEMRYDLPAGARRIHAAAEGMSAVVVNGIPVVVAGESTGARPGRLLRSGRDTDTVTVADGQGQAAVPR